MIVNNISISNVRNLKSTEITLSDNINIFYGRNGQGKTNFLESVYFAAMGRSFRTNSYKEMITFGENNCNIKLITKGEYSKNTIFIDLQKDKKIIEVNGLPIKKLSDLFSTFLVIIFSPEDLNIISGGPSLRRKFLDINLCQLSPIYYNTLGRYYHILNQRNNLLKKIKLGKNNKDTIFLWDKQLVENGIKLIEYRNKYIQSLCEVSKKFYHKITNKQEDLNIIYKPNVSEEYYANRINNFLEKDIVLGTTSIGIHKDDFLVFINDIEAKQFASQGQKRSISLALKLSGVEYIKENGTLPLLLLDDVLSELDEVRQQLLLTSIQGLQTIITCTGLEDILKKIDKNIDITMYEVKDGEIYKS